MKMQEFDITIIGAGPAGLSFACAVAESGLNVAIIDPKSEADLQAPPYDGREIAVTRLRGYPVQDRRVEQNR